MNCKVSNWKTFREQEAEALGKKDEKRLLETRKLSLVVDLDQDSDTHNYGADTRKHEGTTQPHIIVPYCLVPTI